MRILVVEDEALLAQAMAKRLTADGHMCDRAGTLGAASDHLRADTPPDLVLLDVRLPDGNGLDLMARARSGGPAFVVVTAFGDVEDAVAAMKQGASDYLTKPLDLNELSVVVDRIADLRAIKEKLQYARTRDARVLDGETLLGDSPPIVRVREEIQSLAALAGVRPLGAAAQYPHSGRNRNRQGPGGALSARVQPARRSALCACRLRFVASRANRAGVVRPRQGRLHRRAGGARRADRGGRDGDAVSR